MSIYLKAVLHVLTAPPGSHLDDETLAELATAEAAGEDVDNLYTTQLQHIETCLECAHACGELVEMMLTAVEDMAAAAQAVTPLDVYAALLTRQVASQAPATEELPPLIRAIAQALPLHFTRPPATTSEIDEMELATAVALTTNAPSDLLAQVIQVITHNLSTLTAYLSGVASDTWGRALDVRSAAWHSGHLLQFRPGAVPFVPTLSGQETGHNWPILERRVGHPLPLHVVARAERLSALACRLTVRVDRPGAHRVSGRTVHLRYGSRVETAVTDENGQLIFTPVPIAALAELDLIIEEN